MNRAGLLQWIKDKAPKPPDSSDLVQKRRPLMEAWGEWCLREAAISLTHCRVPLVQPRFQPGLPSLDTRTDPEILTYGMDGSQIEWVML